MCRFDNLSSSPNWNTEKMTEKDDKSKRSERMQIYRRFVQSLVLPASSIETLYRHFEKLKDDEQEQVLADALRRRGYSEEMFVRTELKPTVIGQTLKVSGTQSKALSDSMTRIVVVDSHAPSEQKGRNKAKSGERPKSETIRTTKAILQEQEHREFLSHHPFHERFHNMEFLRRLPGNGVMKHSKSSN
jgi:hypothetical protein